MFCTSEESKEVEESSDLGLILSFFFIFGFNLVKTEFLDSLEMDDTKFLFIFLSFFTNSI